MVPLQSSSEYSISTFFKFPSFEWNPRVWSAGSHFFLSFIGFKAWTGFPQTHVKKWRIRDTQLQERVVFTTAQTITEPLQVGKQIALTAEGVV